MNRLLHVFALAAGLLAGGAALAQVDATDVLRQVAASVKAEIAFREVRTSRLLKAPLISSGVLRYVPPGRLEKQTLEPFTEIVTIDSAQIVVDRDGRQTTLPLVAGGTPAVLVDALRAVLGGQVDELQRLYIVTAEGTPQRWTLLLRPRQGNDDVELRLAGTGGDVAEIRVRTRAGDSVTTTLGG